jgi:hypothetical protein
MKFNLKTQKFIVTEKDTRRQIRSYLRTTGMFCSELKKVNPFVLQKVLKKEVLNFLWWNHQGLGSYRGIPDMAGRYLGHPFWIETKAPKGKVSEEQKAFISLIEPHGDKVFVAFSFEAWRMEWEAWIKRVKAGTWRSE